MVKPMVRGNADTTLLHQCSSAQLTTQLPITVSLVTPQGLSSAAQLDQELVAVLEVSTHTSQSCVLTPSTTLVFVCVGCQDLW